MAAIIHGYKKFDHELIHCVAESSCPVHWCSQIFLFQGIYYHHHLIRTAGHRYIPGRRRCYPWTRVGSRPVEKRRKMLLFLNLLSLFLYLLQFHPCIHSATSCISTPHILREYIFLCTCATELPLNNKSNTSLYQKRFPLYAPGNQRIQESNGDTCSSCSKGCQKVRMVRSTPDCSHSTSFEGISSSQSQTKAESATARPEASIC